MAYRRSICTRATLFARRFNPSFTYVSHDRDDSNKRSDEGGCRKIDDLLAQRRCFGTYMGNNSGPGNVFHNQRAILFGIGNGVGSHRFMSTSIGEGVDKVGYLSDAAGAITDVSTEVIASQAPGLSEVAIAAADSAFPVAALQHVIDSVHSFTGLSWAASIALTTVLIRGAVIPLLINQLKSTYKLAIMKPHLEKVKQEMEEKANDPAALEECRQKMNALFKEYGVTPFTPLKGIFIQAPIFISFFLAISNMAEKVPSFKTGGALWFTDLTTPDAMYIFPVLAGLTFLMTVEFNMQEGMEANPNAGTMKKFSRGLAVLTVPFTMSFPKAIFCYWITSNFFSFAYGFVVKRPGVKEALGIPELPVAPPSTSQGTESGFSLFKALKLAAALVDNPALPATSDQSKPTNDVKTSSLPSSSSTAVLGQRIKSLELKVKKRKKNKKR